MRDELSGEAAWRRSRTVVRVASPAAGTDWSIVVPAGHVYRILAITATLATAVAVANRQANLVVGDGTATFLTLPPQAVQAASLTNSYAWAPHAPNVALGTVLEAFLPELFLPAGWTIGTVTGAVQAADQWSAVAAFVIDTTVLDGSLDIDSIPEMAVAILG